MLWGNEANEEFLDELFDAIDNEAQLFIANVVDRSDDDVIAMGPICGTLSRIDEYVVMWHVNS